MSDPRLTPNPDLVTQSEPAQITSTTSDLCRAPNGARDRQLIYGDHITVLGQQDNWLYVTATKDAYCGFVQNGDVGPVTTPTHAVSAPATHVYATASFKSPDLLSLTFGSKVTATSQTKGFIETASGFIPTQHVHDLPYRAEDPATIAQLFLGTPYLWGGNSRWGIDCSGLVQAALLASGTACPGDSDQQQILGSAATGPYRRNDLLFWKGHVALVTGPDMLIHANASAMATVFEPIDAAMSRIVSQGGGKVIAHRRL